jgi:hypothetical protein
MKNKTVLHTQGRRKVFRPLDFLHILIHYSLILKWISLFFHSSIYTQYPIMTKQKQAFRNVSKFMKNTKLKYHIYISIQTLYSVLRWSTFGSDYCLKSSWVWCWNLGTPVFGEFLPFFSADPLKLCQVGWGMSLHNYFQVSPEMFDQVQVRTLA